MRRSDFDVDWIVIGSGFAGSVSALRLAEKGYRVGLIECGRRFRDDDFCETTWQLSRYYWLPVLGLKGIMRLSLFKDLAVVSGCGVGGGSLGYANTLYRARPRFYADTRWSALADWEAELRPHYAEAERMLGVTAYDRDTPADLLLKEYAEEHGVGGTYAKTRVGVFLGPEGETVADPYFGGAGPDRAGCIHCGACMTGCRYNAKNTLVKNYLWFAERLGVEILPERTVIDVKPLGAPDGSRGYRVAHERSGRLVGRGRASLTARGVVVAAGALGTNRLLFRCKLAGSLPRLSDRLGYAVRTNNESILAVTAPDETRDFTKAIAITSSIYPSPEVHIEPVTYGRGADSQSLVFWLMTEAGRRGTQPLHLLLNVARHPLAALRAMRVRGWSRRTVIVLCMQTADSLMRLKVARRWPNGNPILTTEQDRSTPNPDKVPEAYQLASWLARRLRGTPQAALTEAVLSIPTTAHILGGAAIGASAQTGVVDSDHRAFGYENLLVCDGAAIPANLGVNPSLTIAALAERAMSRIPPRGGPDPRAKTEAAAGEAPDPARRAGLDADLGVLRARAAEWAGLAVAEKRAMLGAVHEAVGGVAAQWVSLACRAKGIALDSPSAAEEWMSGPLAHLVYTTALGTTLDELAAGRNPLDGQRIGRAPGRRLAIRVRLPFEAYAPLLLSGFRADVWLEPGITLEEARARSGLRSRNPDAGGVALVLGAGNISSIAPLDALYKLYAEGRVVMLKLNPVNDYLLPVLEQAFARFIAAGYLRIVRGGAEVGAYLAEHPVVDELHVTGSQATHDAIVFGSSRADAARRKATASPRLTKPITSELGGVAPVIVVPGDWSEADLRFQAEHVATQRLHNSGFNCIASQVVVLAAGWRQKERFLERLREAIRDAPARPAYYPGADARQDGARAAHPGAERFDRGCRRTLIAVDAGTPDEAFSTEYFSPVLAVTELPGSHPADFLRAAVTFANDHLYGTLSANVIAAPATLRSLGRGFEETLADLRYGTIGVNCWTGVGFLTARAPWGAYPGHPLTDIGSGTGVVHNALLLAGTERTVVRGPFRPVPRSLLGGELALGPKPPWFVGNRTAAVTARRLTEFAADPGRRALPAIVASALRG